MKNIDIINLTEVLKAKLTELKSYRGAKFTYALLKNADLLDKETKSILDAKTLTPAYQEYETKRIAICDKFCQKDENGNNLTSVAPNGQAQYQIDQNDPAFVEAIKTLQNEYADALTEQDRLFRDFNTFLMQENETLSLHLIALDDMPEDITTEHMSILLPMVK